MKNPTKLLVMMLIMCLFALSGCSVIIQPKLVSNKNVDQWTVIEPNDYDIKVAEHENGSKYYSWNLSGTFDPNNQTVPYWHNLGTLHDQATIRGWLNGKAYPVVMDTGNSLGVLIEDVQINRHDMPVFFFNEESRQNSHGLAIADSLIVGPLEFKNYPCSFLPHHAEHRFLGIIPVHRLQWIVMPLEVFSKFNYVQFDQINKELSISPREAFVPDETSEWVNYPFEIKQKRILLEIPIEGLASTLFLDTGADYSLELAPLFVEQLYEKREDLRRKRKKTTELYAPYAGGVSRVKKFTAKDLRFADSKLNKVPVYYAQDASQHNHFPYEGTDGTIGMGLFKKTVMVLDFKNDRMWIKKAKGSRFEENG